MRRIPVKLKTKQIRNIIRRKMLSMTNLPIDSPCCQMCCGGGGGNCDNFDCGCCGILDGDTVTVTISSPDCAELNGEFILVYNSSAGTYSLEVIESNFRLVLSCNAILNSPFYGPWIFTVGGTYEGSTVSSATIDYDCVSKTGSIDIDFNTDASGNCPAGEPVSGGDYFISVHAVITPGPISNVDPLYQECCPCCLCEAISRVGAIFMRSRFIRIIAPPSIYAGTYTYDDALTSDSSDGAVTNPDCSVSWSNGVEGWPFTLALSCKNNILTWRTYDAVESNNIGGTATLDQCNPFKASFHAFWDLGGGNSLEVFLCWSEDSLDCPTF